MHWLRARTCILKILLLLWTPDESHGMHMHCLRQGRVSWRFCSYCERLMKATACTCTGPDVPLMAEGKNGGCYYLIIFKASVLEGLQSFCMFLCRWCLFNSLPTIYVYADKSCLTACYVCVGKRSHILIHTAGNHNVGTVLKRYFILRPSSEVKAWNKRHTRPPIYSSIYVALKVLLYINLHI
jgi:hypothetical protein